MNFLLEFRSQRIVDLKLGWSWHFGLLLSEKNSLNIVSLLRDSIPIQSAVILLFCFHRVKTGLGDSYGSPVR